MTRINFLSFVLTFATLFTACGNDNTSEPPAPQPEKASISITPIAVMGESVEVEVSFENADVAYCMIADGEATTPSLTTLMKGVKLTTPDKVVFDGLESATTYKIFGVAGRNDIYSNIISVSVTTSYNFPEGGVKAYTTTANKTMLLKEVAVADLSKVKDGAAELRIENTTEPVRG